MPIETATPEQVEQCVDGLLTRIRQLEAENAQLQDARAWARAWKRAAKRYREVIEYITGGVLPVSWVPPDRAEADRTAAEIERLREALAWYVGRSAESLMFDGGRRAGEALLESTE